MTYGPHLHYCFKIVNMWQESNLLLPHQLPDRASDVGDVDAGADAVALGPGVDDGEDGHGVGVLDAAGEVALAGDGDYGVGPLLMDFFPRYGPPRRDEEVDAVLMGNLQQVADFTFHAADAVLHVLGHLDLALLELDTVGKEDHKALRFQPFPHTLNELIVYLDEGLLDTYLRYSEETADHDHEGEKEFDERSPHTVRLKRVPPLYDGNGQEQDAAHNNQYNCRKEAAEGVGQEGVDVAETDGGDIPGEEEEAEDDEGGKGEEA